VDLQRRRPREAVRSTEEIPNPEPPRDANVGGEIQVRVPTDLWWPIGRRHRAERLFAAAGRASRRARNADSDPRVLERLRGRARAGSSPRLASDSFKRQTAVLALVVFLAGGGGGSSSVAPSPPAAAQAEALSLAGVWTGLVRITACTRTSRVSCGFAGSIYSF